MKRQEECCVFGTVDKLSVFPGTSPDYNEQYCIDNDIDVIKLPNKGGAIVLAKGDAEFGHFQKGINNWALDACEVLAKWLQSKGINAAADGNDVMIDGKYKCAGGSSKVYGELCYNALHVSIGMDLEKIQMICKKPMNKIPKGLSSYGLEANEIYDLLFSKDDPNWKEKIINKTGDEK